MAFVRKVQVKNHKGEIDEYLRIVESYREDGSVKQRNLCNLGNVKFLQKNAKNIINGILRALDKKELVDPNTGENVKAKEYGIRYVVEQLWKRLEFNRIFPPVKIRQGKEAVPYYKYIQMMVVNKLSDPQSKLGLFRWLTGTWWPDSDLPVKLFNESMSPQKQKELSRIEVMKFYRAMDEMIKKKEALEKHIYYTVRDLFSLDIDVILYDLTSTYFEGAGPIDFAKLGYSRDHEPGKVQIVVGVILCNGFPIGHEVFEGNRIDKKTVKQILKKLRVQYRINRCVFIGDRGLISKENLEELETEGKKGFDSILALKKRRNNEVKKLMLQEPQLIYCRERDDFEWKEVEGDEDVRYIIVRNPEVAESQKASRDKNIKILQKQLKELKAKANSRKNRNVKKTTEQAVEILSHHHGRRYFEYGFDEKDKSFHYCKKYEALALEDELDGVYILRSKEKEFTSLEIVSHYKDLMEVERCFRDMKDVLDLRPIRHRIEIRVKAHVMICFNALFFSKLLEHYLKRSNVGLSAHFAWESLKNMKIVEIDFNGEMHEYLTKLTKYHKLILKAVKIEPPEIAKIRPKTKV